MISPYASGGALAIVASTTGYGASGGKYNPNGANGGVSYWGSPSLAGEAPALLQISFQGPSEAPDGPTPATAVSLLPDANTPLWSRCTGLMCSTSAARRLLCRERGRGHLLRVLGGRLRRYPLTIDELR